MSNEVKTSKFLSFVLRHKPGVASLKPDEGGWVDVGSLIKGCCEVGVVLDIESLRSIVAADDKGRYSFNPDETRVRANQGHSFPVDLGYAPVRPPAVLFHGTAKRNLAGIRSRGLSKMARHHVHLSTCRDTAMSVGERHGTPVVLEIDAAAMASAGRAFMVSSNGVWLTESIPPEYIKFPEQE